MDWKRAEQGEWCKGWRDRISPVVSRGSPLNIFKLSKDLKGVKNLPCVFLEEEHSRQRE